MTTMRGSAVGTARMGAGSGAARSSVVRVANQTTIRLVGMLAATPAITPTTTAIASADSRWPTTTASVAAKVNPNASQNQRVFIAASFLPLPIGFAVANAQPQVIADDRAVGPHPHAGRHQAVARSFGAQHGRVDVALSRLHPVLLLVIRRRPPPLLS